jgi:DNA repair exonuclease SbcCD nuclease subunit
MKIAIVGDPHIATGFRARVDDYLRTVIRKIKEIAEANDTVIFLGDVFDTSAMPTYVFNYTYKELQGYKGHLHTILGNHDMFHRNLKSLNKTTIGSLDLTEIIKVHTKPFKIGGIEFVPVMTDDDFVNIPRDEENNKVLLCHKYYDMLVCPEESLDNSELIDLNYKYVFMGHDHQPYEPLNFGSTTLFRPGSLTRTTVDDYNKKRGIRYYQLDTKDMSVQEKPVMALPSSEVYLKGSFDKQDKGQNKIKTDIHSLSKLLARFDRKQVSNLSLEEVMRRLNGTEEQILYIRELHRMHNIKYS